MLSAVIDVERALAAPADCRKRSTKAETLARRMSATIGVKMKSTAPLAYAVAVSVSSRPKAVTKMIGVCSDSAALPDQPGRLVAVHASASGRPSGSPRTSGAGRRAAPRARVGLDDGVAERREHRPDREALAGVVVDDEDGGAPGAAPAPRAAVVISRSRRRLRAAASAGSHSLSDGEAARRCRPAWGCTSDAPASMQRWRSPRPTLPVTAMIGRSARRGQLADRPHRLVAVHDRHHDVHRARCRCRASRSRIVDALLRRSRPRRPRARRARAAP